MTRRARGFSLIEMAFVLIIVTLLLGGLLVPFATQVEQKRIAETQRAMEEIKEALLGFAVANGRLPCPDTLASNDGLEDSPCAANVEGNLPWATLGAGSQDAWGNRFYYRVTGGFAAAFGLGSSGNTNVCSASACPTTIASNVPAVVVSYGKNGFGALSTNSAGARNPAPPAINLDEIANQPTVGAHPTFVSRILTLPGAGSTEFDDQVIWLSSNVLFNRMVAAGRLP
jgi:prepilin-type N-terminal cleavage/methylation domain-containing protein